MLHDDVKLIYTYPNFTSWYPPPPAHTHTHAPCAAAAWSCWSPPTRLRPPLCLDRHRHGHDHPTPTFADANIAGPLSANVEGMEEELNTWNNVKRIPLPLRASPMSGWVEAVPYIDTKYSLLLHNDGYALDPFFACELVEALKARHNGNMTLDTDEPGVAAAAGGDYVVAAPMLYESKADKSLAAHATQSNLRLVRDGPNGSVTVRHDHSVRRALNRGDDFGESRDPALLPPRRHPPPAPARPPAPASPSFPTL